jgi:hypothetical protein
MTDQALVEQAEREIAAELGFSLDLSRQIVNTGKESGFTFSFMERYPPMATKLLVKVWPSLVRERCSLLALRKAAKEYADASQSIPNYDAGNIMKTHAALRGALEGER